jgi:anti-sigma B factor antagonist
MLRVHAQKLGNIAILGLRGGVVTGDTAHLRRKVESLAGVNTIVLDFARVNRIDAGGLGVLLELREQTKARGVVFKLINVTRLVKQVLEITRLDSVFEISSEPELIRATGAAAAAGVFLVRGSHSEGCDQGL